MQYRVLARKWRPQIFADLVGQEHISQTLLNALRSGRVAHAFLFSGPRGSGKTTTARILAKALNCHAGRPGEPCGECPACVEIAAGNCLDVLEIDAASNRGIDEIRELRDNVRYAPARDRNKIFIIDEVHMLTTEAFNALLKTLEEPPGHVVFIMATTEYHKIPATILSRCQQYNFKLLPFTQILERLRVISSAEKVRISTPALEQIAFSSGGSMRDAMSGLDQVFAFSGDEVKDEDVTMLLGLVEPAILDGMVRAIGRREIENILKIVGELVAAGQDLQNFCRRLLGQFRNLMVLNAGATDPSILAVPESLLPALKEQAGLFSNEDLLRLFDSLLQTESELRYATQTRFHLEMGLIKLAEISRMRSLEELIAEFKGLLGDSPPPPQSPTRGPVRVSSPPSKEAKQPSAPPPSKESGSSSLAAKEEAGDRTLVQDIANAVEKESLVSILHAVPKADLKEDTVTFELTPVTEFYRTQIRENLPSIIQAASRVVGRPVRVVLSEATVAAPEKARSAAASAPPPSPLLERAKREPIVQSFLETFPGPVKAEEMD